MLVETIDRRTDLLYISTGHPAPIEEVKVYSEESYCALSDCGAWVLNVTWRDKFAENNEFKKVSYDIEVLRTEQMRTVHNVSEIFLTKAMEIYI